MNETALGRMIDAQDALTDALDRDDIVALEGTMDAMAAAVDALRAAGGWREMPGMADEVRQALALADTARIRANLLADRNSRRLDLLAAVAGSGRIVPAYDRAGRVRA